MSDKESLNREIRNKRNRIDSLNAQNGKLGDQLDRLRQARTQIKKAKDDYRSISKTVKGKVKEKREWKGERYDEGRSDMDSLIAQDNASIQSIDQALDAIEMDISRVENELIGNQTMIQRLITSVNSLRHRLKTIDN